MPSLRDGPFARSVVYMCAHREDGAMGIVINQRAEEIEFSRLLVQLDVVGEAEAIRLPASAERDARAARRAGRHRPRLRPPFGRLPRRRIDGADRRRRLPDRDARHPARRSRAATGPSQAVLALGYAGWASGQLESEILANGWLVSPANSRLIFDADFDANYDRALALIGVNAAWLSSDAGHA